VFVVAGLTGFVTPPWAVGALLGALLALLGIIVGVPAYHSVRRSKGRRRGRTHAVISMLAGTALFLVFLVIALVGLFQYYLMRPTCEENLKHIYTALRAYAEDHGGAFPPELETLVDDGRLDGDHWLTCPAYKVPVGRPTYVLTPEINIRAKRPDGQEWWPPDTLIVSDGPPYFAHDDGTVRALLLGGEITHVPHRDWAAYQKDQTDRWSRTLTEIRTAEADAAAGEAAEPAPEASPAPAPPETSGGQGAAAREPAGDSAARDPKDPT
jgi:hypothetical protein